jgi:hypothetical protein
LEIEDDTELIEVRGGDSSEEIIVAIHLLTYDEVGVVPSKSEVVLEGGQVLSFDLVAADRSSSEPSRTLVTIRYRETRPIGALSLLLRQLKSYPTRANLREWNGIAKPAQVFLFALIGIGALLIYFQVIDQPKPRIISVQTEPGASDEGKVAPPGTSPQSPPQADQAPEKQKAQPESLESATPRAEHEEPTPGAPSSVERTRAPKRMSSSMKLLAVKRIYISTSDNEPLSQQIREMLITRLESIGRFEIVRGKEEADAMLDISALKALKGGKIALGLQLVSAEGETIWPTGIKASANKYAGYPADVTDRALKDLYNDIQRMEKRR